MLEFNEEKHEYTLDGKKLISVTQLMQKHGLAPSYAGVSSEVLNAKAERGSLIHKEIEDFNKSGTIGFTDEMAQFKNYVESQDVEVLESEYRVHNDIVAGTIDLVLNYNGNFVVADIKTTYQLHLEAVMWQLSIYAYLMLDDRDVVGYWSDSVRYEDASGQAFHFDKEGNLNVVDIRLMPFEEVDKLMECERKGEIYKYEVDLKEDNISQIASLEEYIKKLDKEKKEAEAKQKALKEALLQQMERRNLKTFEKDGVKITYVAPSTRTTLDSKGIKEKYPDIYEEFSKTSQTSASLRITLKGEK